MRARSPGFRSWTDEEVRQLRKLAAARAPATVIARKLNRTYGAIKAKVRAEGIVIATRRNE